MQILYTGRGGANWDITDLVSSCEWRGDYQQAARSLTLRVAVPRKDIATMAVLDAIDNGEMVRLMEGDAELFRGYVFSIARDVQDDLRTYTAYDGIMHLNKSALSQNFIGLTARRVTEQICGMFGIPVGDMAADGGIALNFACIEKTAYNGIMGAWTQVAKASGHKYLLRIEQNKLRVVQMGAQTAVHVLSPDANLVEGDITRSIEDAITRAMVVSEKGEVLDAAENADERKKYGLLQAVARAGEKGKVEKPARSLLKGEETEITLRKVLGGKGAEALIAGNAAVVEDPGTGLYGKFHILEDSHTFENGAHEVSLTLSFEAVMNEQEITEVKQAKKSTTTVQSGDPWAGFAAYGAQP